MFNIEKKVAHQLFEDKTIFIFSHSDYISDSNITMTVNSTRNIPL